MSDVFFGPATKLSGDVTAPPDKSISHRAAIFGGIGTEAIRITGYLHAEDTHSTLNAMAAIGAKVERDGDDVIVRGVGLRGPQPPDGVIDVGNAGTLMRLLPGWLAAQDGRTFIFDGDASIRRRPVDRVADPLREMGAKIEATDGRFAPFSVHGTQLHGITYQLPVASAQVKSCLLLAGVVAHGETTIIEPEPSRDHTERMFTGMGVELVRTEDRLTITPADALGAIDVHVPGDASSAAFWVAAATLVPGARMTVCNVNTNWTRVGFMRIVQRMGGTIEGNLEDPAAGRVADREPVEDLTIASAALHGTRVTANEVPLAIDELPLVALLGCFAEGDTVVTGAQELRLKESDRIATVVDGLNGLGGDVEATEDGFVVRGTGGLRGGSINAAGDHRIAMLGAIAGLASREGVMVHGMEASAVSYPTFTDDLARLLG